MARDYTILKSSHPTAIAPARIHIAHVQLRDLIICPRERGVVNYVESDAIVEQNLNEKDAPTRRLARLDFAPNSLAYLPTGPNGADTLLAAGGQEAEIHLSCHTPSASGRTRLVWNIDTRMEGTINNSVLLTSMSLATSHESSVEPRIGISNNDCTFRLYDIPMRVHNNRRRVIPVGEVRFDVPINHSSISPDGRTLLSVGDSNKVYFNRISGTSSRVDFSHITTLTLPSPIFPASSSYSSSSSSSLAASFSTAFSADGSKFAVASQEGVVAVWDVRSTRPLRTFHTDKTRSPDWLSDDPWDWTRGNKAPGWCARSVKFNGGDGARYGREVMTFTEHTNLVHVVDAKTFERDEVIRVPTIHRPPSSLSSPSSSGRSGPDLGRRMVRRRRNPGATAASALSSSSASASSMNAVPGDVGPDTIVVLSSSSSSSGSAPASESRLSSTPTTLDVPNTAGSLEQTQRVRLQNLRDWEAAAAGMRTRSTPGTNANATVVGGASARSIPARRAISGSGNSNGNVDGTSWPHYRGRVDRSGEPLALLRSPLGATPMDMDMNMEDVSPLLTTSDQNDMMDDGNPPRNRSSNPDERARTALGVLQALSETFRIELSAPSNSTSTDSPAATSTARPQAQDPSRGSLAHSRSMSIPILPSMSSLRTTSSPPHSHSQSHSPLSTSSASSPRGTPGHRPAYSPPASIGDSTWRTLAGAVPVRGSSGMGHTQSRSVDSGPSTTTTSTVGAGAQTPSIGSDSGTSARTGSALGSGLVPSGAAASAAVPSSTNAADRHILVIPPLGDLDVENDVRALLRAHGISTRISGEEVGTGSGSGRGPSEVVVEDHDSDDDGSDADYEYEIEDVDMDWVDLREDRHADADDRNERDEEEDEDEQMYSGQRQSEGSSSSCSSRSGSPIRGYNRSAGFYEPREATSTTSPTDTPSLRRPLVDLDGFTHLPLPLLPPVNPYAQVNGKRARPRAPRLYHLGKEGLYGYHDDLDIAGVCFDPSGERMYVANCTPLYKDKHNGFGGYGVVGAGAGLGVAGLVNVGTVGSAGGSGNGGATEPEPALSSPRVGAIVEWEVRGAGKRWWVDDGWR